MLKNCTCTGTIAKEWDYSASDLVGYMSFCSRTCNTTLNMTFNSRLFGPVWCPLVSLLPRPSSSATACMLTSLLMDRSWTFAIFKNSTISPWPKVTAWSKADFCSWSWSMTLNCNFVNSFKMNRSPLDAAIWMGLVPRWFAVWRVHFAPNCINKNMQWWCPLSAAIASGVMPK